MLNIDFDLHRSCRSHHSTKAATLILFLTEINYLRFVVAAVRALRDSRLNFSHDFAAKRLEVARVTAPNMVGQVQEPKA